MKLNFRKAKKSSSDADLIEQYRYSHDMRYVGELFQRYTHLIVTLSIKYMKKPEDAEDATMEVFEIIARDLKKHHVENFKAWLFSVTKNHCLKKLRAQRNMPASEFSEENAPVIVDFTTSVALEKQKTEKKLELLESSIENLPVEQKKCIQLFYLQKLSYKEVADQSGFTLKQVKSYVQNGKRNLKISLTE